MYSREKSRKNRHMNEPSFSSTLLDEICRSIDANADNTEDSKFFYRDYKLLNFRGNGNYSSSHPVEDEEMSGFRRDRLVDKLMLKEGNENISARREPETKSFQDKDLFYFSSNSSSSDSSGALSSSSDTDFHSSTTKSRVSCFSSVARPKPVRIGGKNRQEEFDDYTMGDEILFKSKSRALKIYASLRKVNQPISPGGKLTSFINSLFNHANDKKLKKNVDSNKGIEFQDLKSIETSSNCSSTSSFSRSCLSNNSVRNGSTIQRTVRFDPVSVILNEESRPRRSKSIIGEASSKGFRRHSSATNRLEDLKFRPRVDEDAQNDKKSDGMLYGFRKNSYVKDEDDDAISDSSSDLFELDHLLLFGHNRFCQELPMYETTHYGTNLAIRSGLIT